CAPLPMSPPTGEVPAVRGGSAVDEELAGLVLVLLSAASRKASLRALWHCTRAIPPGSRNCFASCAESGEVSYARERYWASMTLMCVLADGRMALGSCRAAADHAG